MLTLKNSNFIIKLESGVCMQGKIELNDLKTLDELKKLENPFERIDYKVRTIITVFGKFSNNKYHFDKFNLDITYIETINEDSWSYSILIKHLGDVVYDSKERIYESNRWETMLDVIFNVSYATLDLSEKNKTKKMGTKKND